MLAHGCRNVGLVWNCCYQVKSCSKLSCTSWKKYCCLFAGDLVPDFGCSFRGVSRATTLIVTDTWKTQEQQLINGAIHFHSAFTYFIYLFLGCHIAGLKSSSKYIQLVYLKKFKCFTIFPLLLNKHLCFRVTFTFDCIFASSSQVNMILFQPLVCLSIVWHQNILNQLGGQEAKQCGFVSAKPITIDNPRL